MLQLISVSDVETLSRTPLPIAPPPPPESALLPYRLQFVSVSIPLLSTPPPNPFGTCPLAIVRPEILAVMPALIKKIRKLEVPPAVLRLTVIRLAPGPWIIMLDV